MLVAGWNQAAGLIAPNNYQMPRRNALFNLIEIATSHQRMVLSGI